MSATEDEKLFLKHGEISDDKLIQMLKYCVDDSVRICDACPFYGQTDCINILLKLCTDRFESALFNESIYFSLLMKAHDELRAAKSCEICIHKDHCDPHAPYESPQWKMWRTCGEVEKKNYRWRGDKE